MRISTFVQILWKKDGNSEDLLVVSWRRDRSVLKIIDIAEQSELLSESWSLLSVYSLLWVSLIHSSISKIIPLIQDMI
jgi:hypothetical protein